MPQIWIRVDAAGVHPVMTDEREELPFTGDVDWHFVAVVEDRQEGERLIEAVRGELAPGYGPVRSRPIHGVE